MSKGVKMKPIYSLSVVAVLAFVFSGCGSDGSSRPSADGKGSIDVTDYLPAVSMTKYYATGYSENGFGRFAINGYKNITVEDRQIRIENHGTPINPPGGGEIVSHYAITYDANNVLNAFYFVPELRDKTTYRHVDIGELIDEGHTKKEEEYDEYNPLNEKTVTIGSTTEESYHCFYKSTADQIKDKNGEVLKENGDFLVIQCDTSKKVTYRKDQAYQDAYGEAEKGYSNESEYLYYLEGEIGLIYYESVENGNRDSGYTYNVTSVD